MIKAYCLKKEKALKKAWVYHNYKSFNLKNSIMNIQNITALADQLKTLGLENAGYSLLKRICFKPESFFLSQMIEKGKDQLDLRLFFEKDNKHNAYILKYYDAIFQKEVAIVETNLNGINTGLLDKEMEEIDWKGAFDISTKKPWNPDDRTGWEKEQKIESIVDKLKALELDEEGKTIAESLKLKYWANAPNCELFVNTGPLKNKSEVSQRFYFPDGQPGISVDEAHRFLLNKWLEKQMQARKKQNDHGEIAENENEGNTSEGSGLLKKKLLIRPKSSKSNRLAQH